MILTDNETKVDLLNNEAISATIIRLLRHSPDRPVTIGIHGDWGAGKSSVLEMIEAGLEADDGILCLKFNGWRFQGFEDAKIALIEGIVTGLVEARPALKRATGALKGVLQRIDWLKVARHGGGLALTTATGIPTPGQLGVIVGQLKHIMSDPANLATEENIGAAIDGVTELLKPQVTTHYSAAELNELREAAERIVNPRVAQTPTLTVVRRTRTVVGKVSAKANGLASRVG